MLIYHKIFIFVFFSFYHDLILPHFGANIYCFKIISNMSVNLSRGALRALSAGQQVDNPICQVFFF